MIGGSAVILVGMTVLASGLADSRRMTGGGLVPILGQPGV